MSLLPLITSSLLLPSCELISLAHRLQRRNQRRRRRRRTNADRGQHQEVGALLDQEGDGGTGAEVGPQGEGDPQQGKGLQGVIEEGEAGREAGPEVGGGGRDR